MKLPRYRVWAGFSLWIGGTILDFYLTTIDAYPDEQMVGMVSLAGFMAAFAWSQAA